MEMATANKNQTTFKSLKWHLNTAIAKSPNYSQFEPEPRLYAIPLPIEYMQLYLENSI